MTTKKILFATMPMDGHLKPLTSVAVHLKKQGYDVRWYSGPGYADAIERLSIPFYGFRLAREINQTNLEHLYPERQRIKGTVARLRFDMEHIFLNRIPEFLDDLTQIEKEFPFDLVVCDVLFMASPFIKALFGVPVVAAGIAPLGETDSNLPPAGMGLEPSTALGGLLKQAIMRFMTTNVLFRPSTRLFNTYLKRYGLKPTDRLFFDALVRRVDVYWQSGVPGFEYRRKAISPTVQFVGPLLPHQLGNRQPLPPGIDPKAYRRVVLVTQGTVERDPQKLLVPTLEAFRSQPNTLVIATTGGAGTDLLRAQYPEKNIQIHDFIDFQTIMPLAHVFVTNAGYGGVLQAIQHNLPMVAAGVHEGKSEIAARINYFGLGISLRTETPTSGQIRASVERILTDDTYRENTKQLRAEFSRYKTNLLCQASIDRLLIPTPVFESV